MPQTSQNPLPHDLSPWGMFVAADIVVQAVMLGLLFAAVLTWVVWLAKTWELRGANRQARAALTALRQASSLAEAGDDLAVLHLTQVNYKTGAVHDMAALTAAAQAQRQGEGDRRAEQGGDNPGGMADEAKVVEEPVVEQPTAVVVPSEEPPAVSPLRATTTS